MKEIFERIVRGGYRNVWFYGAGKTGKKLVKDFHFFRIHIDGIVISSYDGTVMPGTEVRELSEIATPPEDTAFIITSPAKFHGEIIGNLKEHGFSEYMVWDAGCLGWLWKLADYDFTDRRRYGGKCCFILAGYKEFLWEEVFGRFVRFMPDDVEVCILSSGIRSSRLEETAEKNGWSYLSTKINSVTLVQNVAFAVFEGYEWVYKADEDMFVTEGAFEKLYSCYRKAQNASRYAPGIVAPLIPVNGCGYGRILNRVGKAADYERRFGKINIGGNPDSSIEKNPEAAVFMWMECPQIDELNRMFAGEEESADRKGVAGGEEFADRKGIAGEEKISDKQESVDIGKVELCSVRLSIGFILLKRSLWEDMQGFSVSGNADMGTDEEELCSQCMNKSKAVMISADTVAGHFAFGRQTERMKEIYAGNPGWFKIRD